MSLVTTLKTFSTLKNFIPKCIYSSLRAYKANHLLGIPSTAAICQKNDQQKHWEQLLTKRWYAEKCPKKKKDKKCDDKCGKKDKKKSKTSMCGCVGKPIQCKAAIKWDPKKPFTIEDVVVAPPKKGEVRIKIIASSICQTDLIDFADFYHKGKYPAIMGHEGAGIVESVGPDVKCIKPGDRVIPVATPECGSCKFCKNPKTNLCNALRKTQLKGLMPDGTSRFTLKNKKILHFNGTSTFSEYTVVPEIAVAKIHDKAPLEKVSPLGCSVSAGYGAAVNRAQVKCGTKCAVWGLGTVGLAAIMGCKNAGACEIYGIDPNPKRSTLAKVFGMTHYINPKSVKGKIQDYIVKKTKGGVDYSFECVGQAKLMSEALESTHIGWGKCMIVGYDPDPKATVVTLPAHLLCGRTFIGSPYGNYKTTTEIPKLVQEYMNCEIMLDELISHEMRLDYINDAFDLVSKAKAIHVIIKMNHFGI